MRRGIALAILAWASIACEPVGEARIDCRNVPAQHCQIALADARAGSASRLTELVVRCTSPSCTPVEGEVDVEASWAGGNGASWSFGWSADEPARPGVHGPPGPLPVQPVCLGVPDEACRQQAISGMPRGGPRVESITVRCTTVCTPAKGEGETVVRLVDGTSETSNWSYESVGL